MGYIYKITNKINGKIYIGQTKQSINDRWKAHISSTITHSKDYNCPLHLAIDKYGPENFLVEQIEECPNNQLDTAEIYWINKFDSYNNGYNASLGGLGNGKYNYDDIVNYYLQHGCSIKKVCQYFNIYDQVVYTALRSKNIDYKSLSKKSGYASKNRPTKVLLIEKNILFNRMKDIDEYLNKVAHPNIRRCLNGMTEKAYGYHWREVAPDEEIEGVIIYNGE